MNDNTAFTICIIALLFFICFMVNLSNNSTIKELEQLVISLEADLRICQGEQE